MLIGDGKIITCMAHMHTQKNGYECRNTNVIFLTYSVFVSQGYIHDGRMTSCESHVLNRATVCHKT